MNISEYYPRVGISKVESVRRYPKKGLVGWLCWGLTSQSTIFQSYRDGAIASWVINLYFRGVKCLAQGHNTAAVGLEPRTSRSGVRHSTTEPPRSPQRRDNIIGLLHWYQWLLSRVGISKVGSLQASVDIPTRDNIHRFQYDNPFII